MEPLKYQMGPDVIALLADRFTAVSTSFDAITFKASIMEELDELELKGRINLIAAQLREALDDDYPVALSRVVEVAVDGVDGFSAWPLCSFVEIFGVDYPNESLAAMEHLTQRMSCEFAIRPFLDHHLEQTLARLEAWTSHPEATVRRLVSEGTRPRLPWGPKVAVLVERPDIGLSLIEALRHDESEDVRRSVANHLNDVAKAHPDVVVDTAKRWMEDGVEVSLVSHALRTLVKDGHPGALRVLGFTTDAQVVVDAFTVEPDGVDLGDTIELAARIRSTTSTGAQRLVVDFVIHHPNASEGISTKVFKWKNVELDAGGVLELSKRRTIAHASTRTYQPGRHAVDLKVAGVVVASSWFDLRI